MMDTPFTIIVLCDADFQTVYSDLKRAAKNWTVGELENLYKEWSI